MDGVTIDAVATDGGALPVAVVQRSKGTTWYLQPYTSTLCLRSNAQKASHTRGWFRGCAIMLAVSDPTRSMVVSNLALSQPSSIVCSAANAKPFKRRAW